MQAIVKSLNIVTCVCNLITAAGCIAEEVSKAKKRRLSTWEKIHIVTLSLFGASQIFHAATIPTNNKRLENISAATSLVAEIGTIWTANFSANIPSSDAIKRSGIKAFDLISLSTNALPDRLSEVQNLIKGGCLILNSVISIAKASPAFQHIGGMIFDGIRVCFQKDLPYLIHDHEFLEWLPRDFDFQPDLLCPLSGQFILHPVRHKQNPNLMVERDELERRNQAFIPIRIHGLAYIREDFEVFPDKQEEESASKAYLAFRLKYLTFVFERDCITKIPECIRGEKNVRKYLCKITNEPIRFIACPKTKSKNVFYEREALLAMLLTSPRTSPPGWPKNLAFAEKNIIQPHELQTKINNNLKLIKNALESAIEEQRNPRL